MTGAVIGLVEFEKKGRTGGENCKSTRVLSFIIYLACSLARYMCTGMLHSFSLSFGALTSCSALQFPHRKYSNVRFTFIVIITPRDDQEALALPFGSSHVVHLSTFNS